VGFDGKSLGNVIGAGAGVQQVLGDAEALLVGESRYGGQHTAQRYGNVVNVIHQANGFSRERHGFPRRLKFPSSLYGVGLLWGRWGTTMAGRVADDF
jgi:hypothetical protein